MLLFPHCPDCTNSIEWGRKWLSVYLYITMKCIFIYPFFKQVYTQSPFYMHIDCVWNVSTSNLKAEIWLWKGSWQQHGSDCKPKQVKICTDGTCLAQYIFCEVLGRASSVYLAASGCSVPFSQFWFVKISTIQISTNLHFYPHGKMFFVHHYAEEGCLSIYHETYRCQKVIILLFLYSLGAWRKISENKRRNQQQYFVVGYSTNTNPYLCWNLANQIPQRFLYI